MIKNIENAHGGDGYEEGEPEHHASQETQREMTPEIRAELLRLDHLLEKTNVSNWNYATYLHLVLTNHVA